MRKVKVTLVDNRSVISWAITIIISMGVAVFTALVDDVQSLWILAITFTIVVLCYVLVFTRIAKYYGKKIEEKIESLLAESKKTRTEESLKSRSYLDSNSIECFLHHYICCANYLLDDEIFNRIREGLFLSAEEKKYYNFMEDEEFGLKESQFFTNHPSGSIWVVSNALETEIKTEDEFFHHPDESLRRSMEIVQTNIIHGGSYIQFVALGPQGEKDSTYVNRRKKYWSVIDGTEEEKSKHLPIIRIDDEYLHTAKGRDRVVDPDLEYLVKLTSTVLFVDDTQTKLFIEGYFCFRPDDAVIAKSYEKRTIFYRMPKCMQDDYYFFLNEKKKEYFEKL